VIKQNYKTKISTNDFIFNNKYENFINFTIGKYVGEFKLERFLNLITIFRFISENSEKYSNDTYYNFNINDKIKILINNTIKFMKECNNKELNIWINLINKDYTSNSNEFIKNFIDIFVGTFGLEYSLQFNFSDILNKSKQIIRLWYLLKNIYTEIPSLEKPLCNSITIVEKKDITANKCIDNLINSN
jgi:hypothetical protein